MLTASRTTRFEDARPVSTEIVPKGSLTGRRWWYGDTLTAAVPKAVSQPATRKALAQMFLVPRDVAVSETVSRWGCGWHAWRACSA